MALLKNTKHQLEALALRGAFAFFRALPLDIASWLGGVLARIIGRFMRANKTASKNLAMVFPEKSEAERGKILTKMWDNLGRTSAELAHLNNPELINRIKIIGAENFPAQGKPCFFFSGHLANWELLACVAKANNRPVTAVYRAANNKLADEIISEIRAPLYFNTIPKSRLGTVKIVRAIKNNEAIAMLVDQKMNDGIAVPFFGREAMTAPAIAELAMRYDAPIIPARIIRTKGANFEAITYPALALEKTGNTEIDALNIMTNINQMLEAWIREYPEQWFWVHKRWG